MALTRQRLLKAYKMWPNRQTRTLTQKRTDTDVTVTDTVRRPTKLQTLAFIGNIGLDNEVCDFLLPVDTLQSAEPINGDFITDTDGNIWTVVMVARELEQTIFRCTSSSQR